MFLRSGSKKFFIVHFRNSDFNIQSGDITLLPSLISGDFEQVELDWLYSYCKNNSKVNFIDVGANIGVYSILVAKWAGRNSKIVAVEPDSRNLNLLRTNLFLNNVETKIEIFDFAISDSRADESFFMESLYGATSRLTSDSNSGRAIKIVQLDEILGDFISTDALLIKIDIEGYEPSAIRSGIRMIRILRPEILVEFSNSKFRSSLDHWDEILVQLFGIYDFCYIARHGFSEFREIYLDEFKNLEIPLANLLFTKIKILT